MNVRQQISERSAEPVHETFQPSVRPVEFFQRDRTQHPPAYTPGYKTSVTRSPTKALLSLQNSLSEVTGPVFNHNDIGLLLIYNPVNTVVIYNVDQFSFYTFVLQHLDNKFCTIV